MRLFSCFPLYLIARARAGIAASAGRLRSGQRDHGVQSDDAGTVLARRDGVNHMAPSNQQNHSDPICEAHVTRLFVSTRLNVKPVSLCITYLLSILCHACLF
jgi:hypothetical protein